jgi:hypothetical protein
MDGGTCTSTWVVLTLLREVYCSLLLQYKYHRDTGTKCTWSNLRSSVDCRHNPSCAQYSRTTAGVLYIASLVHVYKSKVVSCWRVLYVSFAGYQTPAEDTKGQSLCRPRMIDDCPFHHHLSPSIVCAAGRTLLLITIICRWLAISMISLSLITSCSLCCPAAVVVGPTLVHNKWWW